MKKLFLWIGIASAALVAGAAGMALFLDANQFRPLLESKLSRALGRDVKLGKLSLTLLSGAVAADDLSIAEDPAFGRTPFLRAKSLKAGVDLWPLISSRKLNVTKFSIEQPQIALLQNPAGEWNYSSLGGKAGDPKASPPAAAGGGLDLSVKEIRISGGRLSVGQTQGARPVVLEQVNVEVTDFSPSAPFPFSISGDIAGGGAVKVNGKAGPIDAKDAAMTPVEAALKISGLNLERSGVLEPSTPFAGLLTLEAKATSNGRTLATSGSIKGEKLKLARNGKPAQSGLELDFAVAHDLKKHAGQLSRGAIRIGKAEASLAGSYTQRGESTVVNLDLLGNQMPVPEIAGILPALGVVLPAGSSLQGGVAHARVNVQGPLERLAAKGTLGLDNTKLAGFSLSGKLAVIQALAGKPHGIDTDIQTLGMEVRQTPAGTDVDAIKMIVPSLGDLSGSGTVSPSHQLDFKMTAVLRTSQSSMPELASRGDTTVPFDITGTAENPVFRPDIKGMAREKIKDTIGKTGVGKAATDILDGILGGKRK